MVPIDELIKKVSAFRRKYYINRILRGTILWLSLSLVLFFLFTAVEFWGQFSSAVRGLLFYSALALVLGGFSWQVLRPFLMLWYRPLLKDEARLAQFLARQFPNIDDKIINTLQLGRSAGKDQELIAAAVEQKVQHLKPIPFTNAVTYGENLRLLPYLLTPLLVAFALLTFEGGKAFMLSGDRLIRYTEQFTPPAPFRFLVLNDSLRVEKGKALMLKVRLEGESIPGRLLIDQGNRELAMIKEGPGQFHYLLDPLNHDWSFQLVAGRYRSQVFEVKVVPVPSLEEIEWEIRPPEYTGLKRQSGKSLEPLTVPEGSQVIWRLVAAESDQYLLRSNLFDRIQDQGIFKWQATADLKYQFLLKNAYRTLPATNRASVQVEPDRRPKMEVRFFVDSLREERLFVDWQGEDDYGLRRLDYVLSGGEQQEQIIQQQSLNGLAVRRSAVLFLDTLALAEGRAYKLFLRLWDNDQVKGSKYVQSQAFTLYRESEKEKQEQLQQALAESQENAQKNAEERRELAERLRSMENAFKRKSKLDWQDQQRLKELIKDLEKLNKEQKKEDQALLKQLKQDAKDSASTENKRLQEMAKEVSELEKLKEEIQSLLEELNKDKLEQKLEELRRENKASLRKEERQESLLKDLRFQREVLQKAKELQDLAKRQEELAAKKDEDEAQEQAELNKERENLEEELKKSAEEFEELKDLLTKEAFKQAAEEAKKAMEKAREQSEQKPGSENEAQQQSSESLQEMSDEMQNLMAQMQSQAMEQNAESLRQILDNLEIFSHDVEAAGKRIGALDQNDPSFRALLQEQNRLSRGLVVINDSLRALSERAPEVKEVVFLHLEAMNRELERAKATLQEIQNNRAAVAHQFAMMEANELALLLDESLQNMRQMMAMQKPGKQNCQKPGGGKPSPGKAGKKVQKMGEQKGQKPQGQKPGRDGRGLSGKQLVQIISQQEQLRQELQQMMDKQGETPGLSKAAQELDEMEKELLDGRMDESYFERIKEIESRMLESDKADEQRKQKEERESHSADPVEQLFQEKMKEYLEESRPVDEKLYRKPLRLRPFYKKRKLGHEG